MALTFPSPGGQTPVNTFSPTSTPSATTNGVTYTWDGTKWVAAAGGSSSPATPTVAGTVLGVTNATNAGLGCNALLNNTGTGNVGIGCNALCSNVSSNQNTAVGYVAFQAHTTGDNNTAIGAGALRQDTGGANNTAVGVFTLCSNSTGACNVAVGVSALAANTTGTQNTATGANALAANTTGVQNVAVGHNALCGNIGAANNVAVGSCAMLLTQSGVGNVAVGGQALCANVTGQFNAALGWKALFASTGSGNVQIGTTSATGGYLPVFGFTSGEDNRVAIGSTAVTNAYIQVAFTPVSDARDKIVEGPVPHGLEFVKALEPKAFHFKLDRESEEIHGPLRYGFLAQDVLALEGDDPVLVDNEDENKLRLTDVYLIPVLVNAVKELAAENADLKVRLEALENA